MTPTNTRRLARQVAPLDFPPAEVGVGQVHDRPPQVRLEVVGIAQVHELACQPDECVLHQVLRKGTIPGDEICEPNTVRRVALEQLAEA
jgi:hypothetical protein